MRELHLALVNGVREFSQALIRADLVLGDKRNKTNPQYKALKSLYAALKARTFAMRFLVEQHIHLEARATYWANQLKYVWLDQSATLGDYELLILVRYLQKWRNETTNYIQSVRAQLSKTWRDNKLEPVNEAGITWFLFGNPGTGSMHERIVGKLN